MSEPSAVYTVSPAKAAHPRHRVMAWLLDSLIALGVGILFGGLGWFASAAYWLLRDGLFDGQSIGKRLARIRVVAETGDRRCSFADSAVRNLLWVIPVINVVLALTGLYYLLHDRQGRHWGDRLARTRVVTAPPEL